MSAEIILNGRFLGQPLSGVQRYSTEIISALDRLITDDRFRKISWRLAFPKHVSKPLPLHNIEQIAVGELSGHAWEQGDLWRFSRRAGLLSLGNAGPLLHARALVVLHDVSVFRTPQNYGRKYRLFHRGLGHALAQRSRLGTVSRFSQGEIGALLKPRKGAAFVAYNGCEHLDRVTPNEAVISQFGLENRPFFLFVGSPTRNKNLHTALQAFRQLRDERARFVIVGRRDSAVFTSTGEAEVPGVIWTGRLDDAQMAALYSHARALVFPSLYEGFGIPPLEALVRGTPVLASDIPPVRETCGALATYFQPTDAQTLAALMDDHLRALQKRAPEASEVKALRHRFKWSNSAQTLAEQALQLVEKAA